MFQHTAARRRLEIIGYIAYFQLLFQHTAARRRLGSCYSSQGSAIKVSTHSRPKAAGKHICIVHICIHVSTHSRPKAAGINPTETVDSVMVSTHSRPKAAGNC